MKKRKIPKSILPGGSSARIRKLPVDLAGILERIADEIRGLYIRRRRDLEGAHTGRKSHYLPGPHWDGGVTKKGHQRSSIWLKVAEFCVEHGLDHFNYVSQLFINSSPRFIPQPNHLTSARVLESYRQESCYSSASSQTAYIAEAFEAEKDRLASRLHDWADIINYDDSREYTEVEVQRAILGDGSIGLTPLFRFCLAIQKKQDDIAEEYYGGALLQYIKYPEAYSAVWGSLIPAWFNEAAMACRSMLVVT